MNDIPPPKTTDFSVKLQGKIAPAHSIWEVLPDGREIRNHYRKGHLESRMMRAENSREIIRLPIK